MWKLPRWIITPGEILKCASGGHITTFLLVTKYLFKSTYSEYAILDLGL